MPVGWIVAYSKPSREFYAAENLARRGIEYYLPRLLDQVVSQQQIINKIVPLFPRYIFVHVVEQWRYVLNTYGIAGVITTDQAPAFAPKQMIETLRSREDQHGLIQLPDAIATKPERQQFTKGERVTVKAGHLQQQTGLVLGMHSAQRVRVLFDYLGRKTPVLMHSDDLQLA